MMHCGQTARDFQRSVSQWRCDITISDVHFLSPPTNRLRKCSATVSRVSTTARVGGLFKNHTDWIGKTCRGVGHLRQQTSNATIPAPPARDTPSACESRIARRHRSRPKVRSAPEAYRTWTSQRRPDFARPPRCITTSPRPGKTACPTCAPKIVKLCRERARQLRVRRARSEERRHKRVHGVCSGHRLQHAIQALES